MIPYRARVVKELYLDPNQKIILIIDLHYSHKDECVLNLCKNLISMHQVCHAILNKSYKSGVSNGFIDYVSNLHSVFVNVPEYNEDAIFTLNFANSTMKPKKSEFVARGIQALKTENMRYAMIQCFKTATRFDNAKDDAAYERAWAAIPSDSTGTLVPNEFETEEDVGEVEDQTTILAIDNRHFDIEIRADTFDSDNAWHDDFDDESVSDSDSDSGKSESF